MLGTDYFGWVSTVTRRWEAEEDELGVLLGYWCPDHQRAAPGCGCPPRSEIPTVWPTPVQQDAANIGGRAQARRHTRALNSLLGGVPNPRWLDWYMGLPLGWTDPGSEPTATESFLSWLDAHSYIFSESWWGIPRVRKLPSVALKVDEAYYERRLVRRRQGLDPVYVTDTEPELEHVVEFRRRRDPFYPALQISFPWAER